MVKDGVYVGCVCCSGATGVAGLFWLSFAVSLMLLVIVIIDLMWIWYRCRVRHKELRQLRRRVELRSEARNAARKGE